MGYLPVRYLNTTIVSYIFVQGAVSIRMVGCAFVTNFKVGVLISHTSSLSLKVGLSGSPPPVMFSACNQRQTSISMIVIVAKAQRMGQSKTFGREGPGPQLLIFCNILTAAIPQYYYATAIYKQIQFCFCQLLVNAMFSAILINIVHIIDFTNGIV